LWSPLVYNLHLFFALFKLHLQTPVSSLISPRRQGSQIILFTNTCNDFIPSYKLLYEMSDSLHESVLR
jgi:hypothetical protein